MVHTPFACTEVTLDAHNGRWSIRLWVGTPSLPSTAVARKLAQDVAALVPQCTHLEDAAQVVEFFREKLPLLNAVQVREMHAHMNVGVMAYTQPFEDNDRERFGS